MKMHVLVCFIGLLSILTIVKCNVEHVGKNNINSSGNDDQDDDGTLNGISLNIDEREIDEGLPISWKLRQNKCGKTKQVCKDAGGYCLAKANEDDCDGKLLKGKKYCTKNRKCGCCVPEEGPPCIPETCTYNQTKGICAREKPHRYTYRGSQECSSGCNCYTLEQLSCATRDGDSCDDQQFRRKYTENGNPCVCAVVNQILGKNECRAIGKDKEYCFIDTVGTVAPCGGICLFGIMPHFYDHVCDNCNTQLATEIFCQNRFGNRKKVNHVFYTLYNWGKIDYAVNQYGELQQICIIPEYVTAWYCLRDNVKGWNCAHIQSCTGGGTMPNGNPEDTPGHLMLTSLHCQH